MKKNIEFKYFELFPSKEGGEKNRFPISQSILTKVRSNVDESLRSTLTRFITVTLWIYSGDIASDSKERLTKATCFRQSLRQYKKHHINVISCISLCI